MSGEHSQRIRFGALIFLRLITINTVKSVLTPPLKYSLDTKKSPDLLYQDPWFLLVFFSPYETLQFYASSNLKRLSALYVR